MEVVVLPESEKCPAALHRALSGAGPRERLLEDLLSQCEEPAIDPVRPQVGRQFESQRRTSASAIAPGVRSQQIRQFAVEAPVPAGCFAREELPMRAFSKRDEVREMSLAHRRTLA